MRERVARGAEFVPLLQSGKEYGGWTQAFSPGYHMAGFQPLEAARLKAGAPYKGQRSKTGASVVRARLGIIEP
jgi:hypothetical protein